MPLWLVIMVIGGAGCSWAFLKARSMEKSQTLKKVKEGHKSVKKAAKHLAAQPSGVIVASPDTSREKVNFSEDSPSRLAREVAEIVGRERSGYEEVN